jgi:hypothetical protein
MCLDRASTKEKSATRILKVKKYSDACQERSDRSFKNFLFVCGVI